MEASLTTYQPVIRRLSAALSAVRMVKETMPIQELCVLLEVAKRDGGINIMELSDILGMSQSSATRNVQNLADLTAKKQPGLFLVETRIDPMDMRKKWVHLTSKGRRLVDQIIHNLVQEKGH